MTTAVGTPSGVVASGFKNLPMADPMAIGWRNLYWVDGPKMKALGQSSVALWPDEKGSADFSQTDPTKQPALLGSHARMNGKACVSPDGTDVLNTTTYPIGDGVTPITIVVIAAPEWQDWQGSSYFHTNGGGYGFNVGSTSLGGTGAALVGRVSATSPVDVRYGSTGDPASNVRMFRMHVGPNTDGVATVDNIEQPSQYVGFYWASQPTSSLLMLMDGGWGSKNPVALIGMFVGDVTTDPNWLPFVRWVNSYYGTPNVIPVLPPIPRHRLHGWWDASVDADFTYSFGSDPATPPNKYVSQWRDRSPLKNHAIGSGNPGYHPHRDALINGLKAVDFAALGSYINAGKGLAVPTWPGSASLPSTYAMVVKLPTPLVEDSWFVGCQSSQSVVLRMHANGSLAMFLSGIGGGVTSPAGTVVAGQAYQITCGWAQWDKLWIRVDGVQVAGTTTTSEAVNGADAMGIGAGADWGAQSSNSALGELLVYSRLLAGAELTQVEAYLRAKWFAYKDVLLEPFNDLTTNAWINNAGWAIVAGRTGNGVARSGAGNSLRYTIPASSESAYITLGFAVKVSHVNGTRAILSLTSDGGTTVHLHLQVTTAGALIAKLGGAAGPTLGTSADGVHPINVFDYIEVKSYLHDSAGSLIIRVNGVVVLSLTNIDTKLNGTKTVYDSVTLLSAASGITNTFDDLYISTGPGAAFKGSIAIP